MFIQNLLGKSQNLRPGEGPEILPGRALKFNPPLTRGWKKSRPPDEGSKKILPPLTRSQKIPDPLKYIGLKTPKMYKKGIFEHLLGEKSS